VNAGDGVPSLGEARSFISAPRGVQHFAINAVGEVVPGEIVPEKPHCLDLADEDRLRLTA
jgi:hypothetical protein